MTIEKFYKDNYRIVYGYLLSLCGNVDIAEDLASETFLKALQKIESYNNSCKPSTWLCTIARNLYFNEFKRQKRNINFDEIEVKETISLEEQYLKKDQIENVIRVAKELQSTYREVFFMRIFGLSFCEIGNAIGKSENWARVTFFRAKNVVIDRLEGNDEEL
jgi:RNA polymerase sigma-70 factor (ECF subfamily)